MKVPPMKIHQQAHANHAQQDAPYARMLRLVFSAWVIRNYIRECATIIVLQKPMKMKEFALLILVSTMKNNSNVESVFIPSS